MRTRLVIGTLIAGFAIGGAVILAPLLASAADPEDELVCQQDKRQTSIYDYDESYVDTRNPQQQASDWRNTVDPQKRATLVEQSTYEKSPTEVKVAYRDDAGRTVAVIRLDRRPNGWRLTTVIECG